MREKYTKPVIEHSSVADHFDADPGPACHFDADADPDSDSTFHFDADPDSYPSFQIKAQNLEKVLKQAYIRYIQACYLQIDADPDADPDPADHFDKDADPDPDPNFQFDADPCGSGSTRIRIHNIGTQTPHLKEILLLL